MSFGLGYTELTWPIPSQILSVLSQLYTSIKRVDAIDDMEKGAFCFGWVCVSPRLICYVLVVR